MIELDRIHHADAFDLLPSIADGSVDLVVCDGPYGVTANAWDRVGGVQEFNLELIRIFSRKLKDGGALYLFGKPDCVDFIDYRPFLDLRSKIVWYQPGRLAQCRINYTNNYDVICYFVKGGRPKTYNLDDIRVPQLVELEHRLRCERVPSVTAGKYGKTKFSRKGKNPGDVWGDVKQLTYKSRGAGKPKGAQHDTEAGGSHRTPGQGELEPWGSRSGPIRRRRYVSGRLPPPGPAFHRR